MSRRKRRRKLAGLEKVERRELAAFVLGQRTDQRVRDRDDDDALPSRSALHDQERTSPNRAPDLLATFARAKELPQSDVPDLMSAFARAAREQDFSGGGHDSGTDPDHDVAAGANVYEYGRFESVVQGHGAESVKEARSAGFTGHQRLRCPGVEGCRRQEENDLIYSFRRTRNVRTIRFFMHFHTGQKHLVLARRSHTTRATTNRTSPTALNTVIECHDSSLIAVSGKGYF